MIPLPIEEDFMIGREVAVSTIRVSPEGDAVSIEEVLELVKALRKSGAMQPISIQLSAGDYYLQNTIQIGPEVSAVVIEPEKNERVRLIGGIRVKGFVWDTYNGVACVSAPVPRDREGKRLSFSDFYVEGKRAAYTRWPREGFLYPLDVESHGEDILGKDAFLSSKWFIAKPGDFPTGMKNPEKVIVSYCHYWVDEHSPIKSYDEESGRVEFLYPSRYNISGERGSFSAMEYYLENVAEAFGEPGCWYADNDRIYYVPTKDSAMPENIEAYIPTLEKLFAIQGDSGDRPVRHVVLRDLELLVTKGEHASFHLKESDDLLARQGDVAYASDRQSVFMAGGSVSFRYAENCAVERVSLRHFGLYGICVEQGCSHIRLSRLHLYDGGAGGVKIYGGKAGCDPRDETHDCTVEDCRIDFCGRRYFAACGVLMMHVYCCTVAHCEISRLYYSGISCGWVWGYGDTLSRNNRFVKNHIHHLGMGVLSDMGGIYLLGRQPGTIVAENMIHDIYTKNGKGWALYTDEGSSFITLERNLCYNISENCFQQNYGAMNVVRNNIFYGAGEALARVTWQEKHISVLFENNIFYSQGQALFNFFGQKHMERGTVVSRGNLFWDTTGRYLYSLDTEIDLKKAQENFCLEEGSRVGDPLFADPSSYDFTIAEDSPAYQMGFVKLDFSDVGPRAARCGGDTRD